MSPRRSTRSVLAFLVTCCWSADRANPYVLPTVPRSRKEAPPSLHHHHHTILSSSMNEISARDTDEKCSGRRKFGASLMTAASALGTFWPVWAAADEESVSDDSTPTSTAETTATTISTEFSFENRDRKNNQQAVIRDDYWYVMGKVPPRELRAPLQGADPQWNAFGSCETSADGRTNSCTYVSLNQRIPAYSKYASSIQYGSREYSKLGAILHELVSENGDSSSSSNKEALWQQAEAYLRIEERTPPPPPIDAELKMILLATALLTSPNFPGPNRELLVARFYVNELHHANVVCWRAVQARDAVTAWAGWEFGRDSWNSYLQTVDRQIVPKVGDKLDPVVEVRI